MSDAAFLTTPDTKAILFDCDGTLVDSMPVHREVWQRIFAQHSFDITDEWWDAWANVALLPFVRQAIPQATPADADALNDEATVLYLDALHRIDPLEHVIQVARDQHGTVPLAVVTGGYRDVAVPTLDAAGITGLFDIIVTADDVTRSKPAPDLYVLAMQRLSADPLRCLAYEDSEIGMASARDAGVGRIVDIRDWPTA